MDSAMALIPDNVEEFHHHKPLYHVSQQTIKEIKERAAPFLEWTGQSTIVFDVLGSLGHPLNRVRREEQPGILSVKVAPVFTELRPQFSHWNQIIRMTLPGVFEIFFNHDPRKMKHDDGETMDTMVTVFYEGCKESVKISENLRMDACVPLIVVDNLLMLMSVVSENPPHSGYYKCVEEDEVGKTGAKAVAVGGAGAAVGAGASVAAEASASKAHRSSKRSRKNKGARS